jgi:hypothetical protein
MNLIIGAASNVGQHVVYGFETVFLIWPFFTTEAAPPFLDAVTKHARRIVYLSSGDVGDDLEQETNTITARIPAKLGA